MKFAWIKPALMMCALLSTSVIAELSFADRLQRLEDESDTRHKLQLIESFLIDANREPSEELALRERQGMTFFSLQKWTEAQQAFVRAEFLAASLGLPAEQAQHAKMTGVTFFYQGRFLRAIEAYKRALSLLPEKNGSVAEANLISNIGLAYFNMYDLPKALANYTQAQRLYRKFGDDQDRADILSNLAGVYIRMGRHDSAIEMYQQSKGMFEKLGSESGLARANGNIGVAYKQSGRPVLAERYYLDALAYYQSAGETLDQAVQESNLSNLYSLLEAPGRAKGYALKSLEHSRQSDSPTAEMVAWHALGKAQFALEELAAAEASVKRSIDIAREINEQLRVRDGLALSALIAAGRNDFQNALNLFEQYVLLRDELSGLELKSSLNEFQAQFETEELTRQVEELELQQRYTRLAAQQQYQGVLLASGLAILLLVAGFAFYHRREGRRQRLLLEETVRLRTHELEKTTAELSRANTVKSQFLANMSHEFRTPLTSIMGRTENILSHHFDPSELRHELQVIHNNSQHLASLINDVLDLSKIEANKLELNVGQVRLSQLLQELEAMFVPVASEKGITFKVLSQSSNRLCAKLDYVRVKQVLINLCSNAVKFTQRGEVTLLLKEQEQGVCFCVTDSGIGIRQEQLKEIFQHFSQGDNSVSRIFGGTGLGLSLSRQLAGMMGGYIDVESEVGKGSKFSFVIPCVTEVVAVPKVEHEVHEGRVAMQGSVLLAEDNKDIRQFMSRLLSGFGLEVLTVENGQQAVEKCLIEHPDLVLMDIQMPIMDGMAALALLRQSGYHEPVFALTANALSHEVEQYRQCGFTGHFSKPLDQSLFAQTLARYLSSDRAPKYGQQVESAPDMTDLVERFADGLEDEKALLEQAIAKRDLAQLKKLAHRLAGASKVFGYDDIGSAASNVELMLKRGETEAAEKALYLLLDTIDGQLQKSSTSPG